MTTETRLPYEGKAHPESVVYVADYTAALGVPPTHNTMVQALVARGLSRTRARHDWQVLVKHHQAEQEKDMMDVQVYPLEEGIEPGESVSVEGDAQVQALRAEVEALKRDAARARTRERALEGAVQQVRELVEVLYPERQREALEARVALLEAQQQPMLALVEEFRALVRAYPSVGRAIMALVRTHSSGDYALLFWLGDRLGLPLDSNDRGQRQQHFSQGLLVPGGRR